MNVTVFGAGGMGLYFAALLARAGHRVTLVGRESTVAAAAAGPLTLTRGEAVVEISGVTVVSEVPPEPVDLVVVAVKAWQVTEAARALRPTVGPRTVVLPLQNGVEAAGELVQVLGPRGVLGCSAVVIAKRTGPLAVACLGSDAALEIGPATEGFGLPLGATVDALTGAGIAVSVSDDIEATLWRKLMLISSYGGVGALARQPVGVTSTDPHTHELVRAAMVEVLAVARARGVRLGEADVDGMMKVFESFRPDTTSSMQRDLLAGRPSELEFQNGAVVRFGREVGVPTPIHRCVYASQLPGELAARKEA
ncbi:2-dehydropantoate 2-reductase [Nocardia sp. CDC159]|uniref:2-dehydropantoate 2-reductase n=1 Tax=Nocardia pulmonis TaxID=2951408 RepID=A0A9X2EH13_9NOCA|nr:MULTISPECIES: 2-dehydropantoate 2-reductase [Nocardia]MCM6778063.1 2-dehydropantoate 2-reductase [Nocardia pulmonis]MCM6790952.1 2-dehydropantoate 2-reductase [Nocardia sp. CDC159]